MFRIRACLTNTCLAAFDAALMALVSAALAPDAAAALALGFLLSAWLGFSFYFGMYRSRRLDSPFADWIILVKVSAATWIAITAAASILPALAPLEAAALRLIPSTVALLALAKSSLRLVLRELRRRGRNVKDLVLVTSPEMARRLADRIQRRAHYGYRIARQFIYVDGEGRGPRLEADVDACLAGSHIDDMIVALPAGANDLAARLVRLCDHHGVNVRLVPDLGPVLEADTQIYNLDGIPLIDARLYPTESFAYAVFKRLFDVCVSLLVLTILSPVYLLIALLVKATSPGPALFVQERVGMNGRRFRMLKFRTMHQHPSLDPRSHWTVPNDRHITRVGRWLRRTNLDELPQFLNVLKGDMSIVGPRPERPFFLERFRRDIPQYMARHYVKSGITGWAQVHGWRGDTPIPERVAHDLYYIRHWAMALDVKILLLTVRTLFQRDAG